MKITSVIPALLLFMPKRYFLGKNFKSTAKYKGPLIITANHRGFIDYVMVATMFPFRKAKDYMSMKNI